MEHYWEGCQNVHDGIQTKMESLYKAYKPNSRKRTF